MVESGLVKVVVPHVEMHRVAGRRLLAPELARGEADRVQVLRLLAGELRIRIGEYEYAVVAHDHADLAPRVARQPRVAGRMDVARAGPLAHRESRRRRDAAARRVAPRNHLRNGSSGDARRGLRRSGGGAPRIDLLARDEAACRELVHEPRQPPLVIAHSQVLGRRQQFELMARVVEILAPSAGSNDARHGVHASFPRFVENRLVRLVPDRSHAVHAAHVMDAVHTASPGAASDTFATPTIASRVTSAASCASLKWSAPAGRSGSTM